MGHDIRSILLRMVIGILRDLMPVPQMRRFALRPAVRTLPRNGTGLRDNPIPFEEPF